VLAPVPDPRSSLKGYPRHRPTDDQLRAAVRAATAGTDWPRLCWSALLDELLSIGRADIPLARLAEGHIDALRICDQAGTQVTSDAIYGVWASKSGATGARASTVDGGYVINGTVKFASGAGLLDRALVPVVTDHDQHLLLDISVSRLSVDASAWQTSAMMVSRTHTVEITGLEVGSSAIVGPPNFYLDRSAFFPGGVGVAAVWTGGLARVCDLVLRWIDARRTPLLEARLGRLRLQVATAASAVSEAGRVLDQLLSPDGQLTGELLPHDRLRQLAGEARAIVGDAVRAGLDHARLLGGPAALAFDVDLTRAIDDLGLYVLQQSSDNDAAFLGQRLGRHG
jgi:alkylation response protein AidB-like acyl-CoA dehydrogenase